MSGGAGGGELPGESASDAADTALMQVHRQGPAGRATLLDAMAAAEEAFDASPLEGVGPAAQPQPHPHLQALLSGRLGEGAPPHPEAAAACVHEATRERTIQQLFASLLTNPSCNSRMARDVMASAQEIEEALHHASHSTQVYLSLAANAVRLARSVADVADIPRVAAGEPREVAEGHTTPEATPYIAPW